MSDFLEVAEGFWISPQISVEDVRLAADRGFAAIVNNRPEGESPSQTPGPEIEAAASAAGVAYIAIPVRGRPAPEQVQAMREALDAAEGPVLAYCAGGVRSLLVWALAEVASGARDREDVLRLARAAGYDFSGVI